MNQIQKPLKKNVRKSEYRKSAVESIPEVKKFQKMKTSNNMDDLFLLKKFGDDQLAELSFLRFIEAKRRLRHFVMNTDMKSDPKEKRRLIAYF